MNFDNALSRVSGYTLFGNPIKELQSLYREGLETDIGNGNKVSKKAFGVTLANVLIPLTALGIIGAFAALAPRYIPKLAAQRTAIYATAGTAGAFILVPTVAGISQAALLAGRRTHQAIHDWKHPTTTVSGDDFGADS